MTKDTEIEQVLSLPNEKWQRKKQRAHSVKGLQTILPKRI